MSYTTLTVPHMHEPPRRHDIRVAKEGGRHTDPATFAAAASQAAAGRDASIVSAHTADGIICVVSVPAATGPQASPSRWPSSPMRSAPGIRCHHPAGKRVAPAVVRGLIKLRLPQLIMAGRAGDHRVPHAPAARRGFPGRPADTRLPAHLRPAGPQPVTERAAFRLVLEQRTGHLNDHARTNRYASMITAAGPEPGPGGISPGAAIRTRCADRGGSGQGQHRMGWATAAHTPAVAWPSPRLSSRCAPAASSSAQR
jgi:hypothetical protein